MDERTGAVHDYTRKSDIQHSEIMAPEGAPDWSLDRPALWNAVESAERRKDAQVAREVQLALPRELDSDAQVALVRTFVRDEFVALGMVADFSLHDHVARDGGEQPHAHVMLTMRSIDGEGFGLKVREWNSDELLVHWREQWAQRANAQLAEAGVDARIDHRSLAAQREEALAYAAIEPEGDRRDALEVRAAEMDREPSPYLRASWYMEQKAQRGAEACGQAYEPVTDRGSWFVEVKVLAAERLEQVREFAQGLAQRAAQTWRHLTGQDEGSSPGGAQGDAAEHRSGPTSSAMELLQRAGRIAQTGQTEGASSGIDRLQRGRDVAQGAGQIPLRGHGRDDQGQD